MPFLRRDPSQGEFNVIRWVLKRPLEDKPWIGVSNRLVRKQLERDELHEFLEALRRADRVRLVDLLVTPGEHRSHLGKCRLRQADGLLALRRRFAERRRA